jgi:hypothetical protein
VLQGVGEDQDGSLCICMISFIAWKTLQLVKYYIISEDGELYLEPLDSIKGRLKYYPSDAQELLTKQGVYY